jgi:hypothetical protein
LKYSSKILKGLDLNSKKIFGKGEHYVPLTEYSDLDLASDENEPLTNRTDSDYMEPALVEAKSKMRDASEIPKISIQVFHLQFCASKS